MNKMALLNLAEMLETAELPGEFDMDVWFHKGEECGTAGCAIGWGIELGRLPGLVLLDEAPRFEGTDYWRETSFGTITKYFGVSTVEAEYLFLSESYDNDEPTRQEVADRIKEFVNERENQAAVS